MTLSILGIVGSVITLIAGPLLAFWIKKYWDDKAAAAAAAQRQAEEEKKNQADNQNQSHGTSDINSSIDKQKDAADQWAKNSEKRP
jgi:nitric oxide reductase activation protein